MIEPLTTAPADEIVATALSFCGTPFVHQGRVPGVGMDCAGVPICSARAFGIVAADFDVTGYPDMPDGRSLRAFCDEYLEPIEIIEHGCVALVSWALGPPQHLGIIDKTHKRPRMIHAENLRRKQVCSMPILFSRAMRLVQAYRIPGVVPA